LQKNDDLKTLFNIRSDNEIGHDHGLLLEIGKDYCSYGLLRRETQTIDQLQFMSFEETELDTGIKEIIDQLNVYQFQSVTVSSGFPQAVLVPARYFNEDHQVLDVLHELPAQAYLYDRIAEWQIVNTYGIPQTLYDNIQQAFPQAQYLHVYTPGIKIYNGYVADSQMSVHFTPHYFRVILKKEGNIHLAQTYFYASPLDVIYYLLKICYEFNLDQSSVFIILSGLVEKESNLYKEVEQYFTNIHFAHPPELKLPANELPHYFFTSLYNLATCVS
jgi:hypothetical protein